MVSQCGLAGVQEFAACKESWTQLGLQSLPSSLQRLRLHVKREYPATS